MVAYEEEYNDVDSESSEASQPENNTNKRKLKSNNPKQHKKIKYEDIGDGDLSKRHKKTKQPTAEELNSLTECETLYSGNLFRLQLNELLTQIKIKEKYKAQLTEWLKLFENTINEIPNCEAKKFITKTKPNLTINSDQDMSKVQFSKPESIETFGLFKLNALPGPQIKLNVNLEMNKSCFHVKDYLNNRYFTKRYYYLLYIENCLLSNNICSEIEVRCNASEIAPFLRLIPKNCPKVTVCVFITPPQGYFSPSRFLPDKNNLKDTALYDYISSKELLKCTPTVYYNSVMCYDVVLSKNCAFFGECLKEFEHVREGLKLLCVWSKQRAFPKAFSDELLTSIVCYLLVKRKFNKYMSSYQVVRMFWNFILTADLPSNPVSLCETVTSEVLNGFKQSYDLVVLDTTGCYNFAAHLDLETFLKVKSEAQISLELLNKGKINSFYHLFICKLPLVLQYDLILDINSSQLFKNIEALIDVTEKNKYAGNYKQLITNYVTKTLRKALNDRATLIVPYLTEQNNNNRFSRILYGINLNPDEAFNILTLGPLLNDPEEQQFKNFWTHLASNRRFRDGTARITVYFETKSVRDRRNIIETILSYVVNEKLDLKFKLHYNCLDNVITNKKIVAAFNMGTNEECCFKIITKSDELGKILRELDLSLTITSVQGASEVFCYSDVFPPVPTNYKAGKKTTKESDTHILIGEKKNTFIPNYLKPIESVLQLEHSSKWPKNLQAIRHMKTAFYLEISKLLHKKHAILSSVTPESLDVFYEGLVYRYKIYISREIALLKKESDSSGVVSYKDSAESIELDTKLNVLPKIVSGLKGLQSQYPSFGPSTAIIKRWLSSQLIDNYLFPDLAVNLINASLYSGDAPFLVSMSPQVAFFRFLKFFSETQWDLQCVVVNFTDEISRERIDEIESDLQKNRQAYPNLVILTPYDRCESVFTKAAPCREVLTRVKQLALGSLKFFEGAVIENNNSSLKELFVANYVGYNVVIRLKPLVNPRRHEEVCFTEPQSKIIYEEFNPKESTKIPIVGFDPVQIYLKELRENFGEFATFFHDTYGGNSIAVLWKPQQLEKVDFKVSCVNGRKYVDEKLVLNVDALIEDFYIMGRNVVKVIEKN